MVLDGTIIVFSTRTPTQFELDNCMHLQLGSNHEWNPSCLKVPRRDLGSLASSPDFMGDAETVGAQDIFNIASFSRRLLACCKVCAIPPTRSIQGVLTHVTEPPSFTTEIQES